jgi:imidazole glycerol-phosphate synthase subunit HisF
MVKRKMFYGAGSILFENAKMLRKTLTPAENILWGYLKTKPSGYKFRRQHPLGIYIADFYCHSLKLVIEVDGLIHNKKEVGGYDKECQSFIEADGIKAIRFTNEEVETALEKVIAQINLLLHD